jgi:hypothetical protein
MSSSKFPEADQGSINCDGISFSGSTSQSREKKLQHYDWGVDTPIQAQGHEEPTEQMTRERALSLSKEQLFANAALAASLVFSDKIPPVQVVDPSHGVGALAEVGLSFCPVGAIRKYPYKWVTSSTKELIESHWSNGRIFDRDWDM